MRVRLNTSAELDDVPSNVAENIDEAIDPMQSALELITAASIILKNKPESSAFAVELIDKARRDMSTIDALLAECQNIAQGYVDTKQNIENPQPVATPNVEPTPPPVPEEAIQSLRDALGTAVEETETSEVDDVLSR